MPDSKTVVKSGSEKSISPAVIKRLPRYYRYLGDLLKNNVVRISSKELSQRMNVTASQILAGLVNRDMVIMWSIFIMRWARFLDWIRRIILLS